MELWIYYSVMAAPLLPLLAIIYVRTRQGAAAKG